jgi:hypothetical protein
MIQRQCDKKDALGRPGEGFHKHFWGIALGDVLGTVAIAGVISYMTTWRFIIVLLVLFIVAEALHWYFCVDTAVIKFVRGLYNEPV